MDHNSFMNKLKIFLGIHVEPPRNDFRNPIWGSDDDDEGDELYTRQNSDINIDPFEFHRKLTQHMNDMFHSMTSMFGDMKLFLDEEELNNFGSYPSISEVPPGPDDNTKNIRDYYLKPGYQKHEQKQDIDLDGQISSTEISGLLKQKKDKQTSMIPTTPFNGNLIPGTSFCQTVITTSVKKPDGTIETKRIVKNGHDVVEETTTTTVLDPRIPVSTGMDVLSKLGVFNLGQLYFGLSSNKPQLAAVNMTEEAQNLTSLT